MNYILMADIVKSRALSGMKLQKEFRFQVEQINLQFRKELASPLTITLGDEFQGVLNGLNEALQVITTLEQSVALSKFPFQLRYVLYYGKIDTAINHQIAYGMLGDGLAKAREQLQLLKKEKRTRFYFHLPDRKLEELLANSFLIFQSVIDEWKTKDREVIAAFLSTSNYREAAAKCGRDSSLMWRREQTLHIREFKAIKNIITNLNQLK
ncbi:MAG: SatD family protein [Chitinophagales bacterium]